jgi:hypothetical protein
LDGDNTCIDYFSIWDINGQTDNQVISAKVVPAGQWYHLAYVYSGSSLTIYVNGALSQSKSGPVSSSAINATRLYNYFGLWKPQGYDPYNKANVVLDEVRLYNKALTQNQVQLDMMTVSVLPPSLC